MIILKVKNLSNISRGVFQVSTHNFKSISKNLKTLLPHVEDLVQRYYNLSDALSKARTRDDPEYLYWPYRAKTIHLRKPSLHIGALKEIYQACKCNHTIKAKENL